MPATYEPIATQTLGSAVANVDFNSIPATYTDLILIISTTSTGDLTLQINSDTGTNYSQTFIYAYSVLGSTIQSNITSHWLNYGANSGGYLGIMQFLNYSNTTTFKSHLLRTAMGGTATDVISGLWRSTAAINALKCITAGTFAIGSTFTLYGIKAA